MNHDSLCKLMAKHPSMPCGIFDPFFFCIFCRNNYSLLAICHSYENQIEPTDSTGQIAWERDQIHNLNAKKIGLTYLKSVKTH